MLLCEKSKNNSNTIAEPLRSKQCSRDYPARKRIWMKIGDRQSVWTASPYALLLGNIGLLGPYAYAMHYSCNIT